jgi:hypothetical protein
MAEKEGAHQEEQDEEDLVRKEEERVSVVAPVRVPGESPSAPYSELLSNFGKKL